MGKNSGDKFFLLLLHINTISSNQVLWFILIFWNMLGLMSQVGLFQLHSTWVLLSYNIKLWMFKWLPENYWVYRYLVSVNMLHYE